MRTFISLFQSDGQKTHLPAWLVWGALGLGVLTWALGWAGVSTGFGQLDPALLAQVKAGALDRDDLYLWFSSGFVHGMLEWGAVGAALFTTYLVFSYALIARDVFITILGLSLLASAAMDLAHMAFAEELLHPPIEYKEFVPYSMVVTMFFHGLVNNLAVFLAFQYATRENTGQKGLVARAAWVLGAVTVLGGLLLLGMPSLLGGKSAWFHVFQNGVEAGTVAFYLAGAVVIFPRMSRKHPTYLTHGLAVGMVLHALVVLHLLGRVEVYPNHFFWAHILKVMGYVLPFVGISLDYYAIHRRLEEEVVLHRQTEQELFRIKNTLDRTLDSVFILDGNLERVLYVNQGTLQALGMDEAVIKSMPPPQFLPELATPRFAQRLDPLLEGTQKHLVFETTLTGVSGRVIPVELFFQYLPEPKEMGRFVAIAHDVTERRRVDRIKNDFISTVSHELRTPLTSIRGALDVVASGMAGEVPPQALGMVEVAQKNCNRLVGLVNDILDIQKIEAGRMEFHLAAVDVMEVVFRSLEENYIFAQQHEVRYVVTHTLPHVAVMADKNRMIQVMTNLLSNAAKFSPLGGQVEVEVDHAPPRAGWKTPMVRVSVLDHGPGISPAFMEKIFQKFSQGTVPDDGRIRTGTGLGLSISKAIIEHMGGAIGVESQEGHGSAFYFDLPVVAMGEEK